MKVDRKFKFSNAEMLAYYPTQEDWRRHVRKREVEFLLAALGDCQFERALELGSGDGTQAVLLADRCKQLTCSDIVRERWELLPKKELPNNISYIKLDAADLSQFPDNTFDLVYSSNLLEHIEDVDRCIREIFRVTKSSGIGVHTMPSRYWKFFNSLYRTIKLKRSKIHGVESTNWDEFISFGVKTWINKFDKAGFETKSILGMPFYFGFGLRWKLLIVAGNWLRFPSSHTLIVQPKKSA